jgi:hypothetical protein
MVERATATKCSVADLLRGRYNVNGSTLNYVETPYGEASRVNLVAAVVAKPGKRTLIIDDGSGQVEVRAFDDDSLFEPLSVGGVLLLIGRPRRHEGQTYVVAEICKLLSGPKWLELRRAELTRTLPAKTRSPVNENKGKEEFSTTQPPPIIPKQDAKKMVKAETPKAEKGDAPVTITSDKIIDLIRQLDDGGGAAVEKVLAKADRADAETMLTNLLAEGEIFEIRPGRVKVLE